MQQTRPDPVLVVLSIATNTLVAVVQFGGLPLTLFTWWRLGFSAALVFLLYFVVTHWVLSPAAAEGLSTNDGELVTGFAAILFLSVWGMAVTAVALWLPRGGPAWLQFAFLGTALSAASSPIRVVVHKYNDAGLAYHPVVQQWMAWATVVSLAGPFIAGITYSFLLL